MKLRAWAAAASVIVVSVVSTSARATFLVQIEQVIGGAPDDEGGPGDITAQAIQLRYRKPGDISLEYARLRVWDANGENPITIIDFGDPATEWPPGGLQLALGYRILIASPNLSAYTDRPVRPDFTMTNLIPEAYLAAGRITFEYRATGDIYWSLSYGGAAYTGPTTGMPHNDDDGDFGPPFDGPLPSNSIQGLLFVSDFPWLSSTNADDYALTPSSAVFMNNAGDQFRVIPGVPTLSHWGLVVMTLLVTTAGTLVLARNRATVRRGN
jgi:hypothetical protein